MWKRGKREIFICDQGVEKEGFVGEVMSGMNLTELLGLCQKGKAKVNGKKNKVIC